MLKPVIALSSIAMGVAVLGFALNKPYEGHKLVSSASPVPAHREIAAARPMEVLPSSVQAAVVPRAADTPVTETEDVMTIQTVTIRGPRRAERPHPRAGIRPPAVERSTSGQLNPCSDWRELGPHSGVRMLCPGSAH